MLGHKLYCCICYSCCRPTLKKPPRTAVPTVRLGSHWHSCPGITLLKFSQLCALSHGLPVRLEQCHKLWSGSVLKGTKGRKSGEGCAVGAITYLSEILTQPLLLKYQH